MTGEHPPDDGTEEAGSPRVALPPLTRRRFLTFATATGALVYTGDLFTALAAHAAPDDIAAPPFVRSVRRREGFLALTFEFHNLKLDNSTPRKLVKTNKNKPAFLGVVLPPQHLADETFEVDADLPSPGEVRTRLAAPTRLVFEVPATVLPLAFDLETLLDWSDLPQRVVPLAQPNVANPESRAPHPDETAIELPWALVLSPTPEAGWSHATVPVTHDDRTELWHSRLGNRGVGGISAGGDITYPLLAVWARKSLPPPDDAVFPLDDTKRAAIVSQTTERILGSRRQPLRAKRLMLSSLGGWLEGRAAWSDLPLAEWTHRTAMGRDTYVKVVERGHLFPFGHKAVYTEITERRFEEIAGGYKGAYLITWHFVTVLDPVRAYGVPGHPDGGRRFPYRSVRITTLTTPDLSPAPPDSSPFVPKVGGAPFLFDLIGTDWAVRPRSAS